MPATTVICNYWNNAWILADWIPWHARLFDHGIMIDHGASDGSTELIRELAPGWEIRPTARCREAYIPWETDLEVMEIEQELDGWKMCLNVTEFLLLGSLRQYLSRLPAEVEGVTTSGVILVDRPAEQDRPPARRPVFLERHHGWFEYELGKLPSDYGFPAVWRSRLLHRHPHGDYEAGRHVSRRPHRYDPDLFLVWTGWSPFAMIREMKMSVQQRIPASEFEQFRALQHKLDSEEQLLERLRWEQARSHDLFVDPRYRAAVGELG